METNRFFHILTDAYPRLVMLALAPVLIAPLIARAASVRPEQLRCEYRKNPLGIDAARPRLSWVLIPENPKDRGLKQAAYHILVASSEEGLRAGHGDLWDSGRVDSDQSTQVVYDGKPLESRMQAFWKVELWDQSGNPSGWSAPAQWSMGLLRPEDWKAKWIGRDDTAMYKDPDSLFWNLEKARWIWSSGATSKEPRFFRDTFLVPAGRRVVRAICIMGADRQYELFLNGEDIGRGNFIAMPDVFDVTERIRAGENLVAVRAVGQGADKPAGLIAAIRIEFASGDPLIVTTSGQWRAAESSGADWQKPGFNDSAWTAVKDLGPYGMEPWGDVGFIEEQALPARMLRREFEVRRKVKRATVYVSGLGLSEVYVNGSKIGDDVLSPGLTDYSKRVFYVTCDVTRELISGHNAIGLILGNGRYWAPRAPVQGRRRSFGYPKALLQLEVEYDDGTKMTIFTDDTWKLTTNGPIRANNEYDGEQYDARMELNGWDRAGYDDSKWQAAQLVSPPAGKLVAQMAEPLQVTKTLHPERITEPWPGVYVFDMGQNMVGWCRLKVAGPRGTRVTLRHAETLRPDGMLYVANLRTAKATDEYTLKGGGTEVWEPRFTYHGFRYVEVRGYPGKPTLQSLEGRVVNDAMTETADFSCSNPLLNQIHHNIFWGVRGNYRSIPTDCPQRDERQGWLGDRSMVSRSESYLFDVAAFYSKWESDISDSQRPTGSVPDVVPNYWVLYHDDVTWPSTFLFVPEMLYDQYGDLRVIEREYPAMKRWIDHMQGYLKNDLMPRDNYGDWCVPPEDPKLIHSKDPARKTDGTLIGTAYYYHLLGVMARYARLLDKPRDASEYEALASRIKAAFEREYFHPETGTYSNGTQTSSILPLAFDMTPRDQRKKVFAALVRNIEEKSHGHIGTGLVGAQWLMRTLSDNGRADIAYQIAAQKTYPGWGYMVEKGATTIWELWNGDTADPSMNSGNHVMQIGDLGIWLYADLAGIRSDPEIPGFKHVIIRPDPVPGLSYATASHRSMYGMIRSYWKREGSRLHLNVTIPANTTATVYVPAKDARAVTESGRAASRSEDVKFLRMEDGRAVYEVQSGSYSFSAPL